MAEPIASRPASAPAPGEATLDVAALLRRQFASLRAELDTDGAQDQERAIHRARRLLKSMRGLLRLAWPRPGDRAGDRARLDRALADIADHLAPARDERVMARAAETLARRCRGAAARHLKAMAQALHDGAVRHEGGSHGGARHRALMASVDRALADLRWPRLPGDVAVSIGHSLRRSRRRLAAGLAARDVDALHAARTAAVRLMVQLEAVAALRGGFGGRIARLDALRDVLGEHHDLAILGARIAAQGDGGQEDGGQDASADVKAEVLAVLGARQKRLEREAVRLHAVVHATPAGRLRKKVLRRLAGLRIGTA